MDPNDSSSDSDIEIAGAAIAAVQLLLRSYEASASSSSSQPRQRRRVIRRDRESAHTNLWNDYFADEPVYPENIFRQRFRMSKALFLRIVGDLQVHDEFFQQRYDAAGRPGFTPYQKCTSAIRQLAYALTNDFMDCYLKMSARVAKESLLYFCQGIVQLYGPRYLRRPTASDLQRIYEVHERKHGFPGMIGSIDCMHWQWGVCPNSWHGGYKRGDIKHPTLILQAVASYDLWIWNAYFGMPGTNNDINVFESSPLLEEHIKGFAPIAGFNANGSFYQRGYYLGDGIYPAYAIFVKTFTVPIGDKRKYFKTKQESARKDIERAFGVLKKRWRIISSPARWLDDDIMHDVMYACIILHNMILEDEGKAICQNYDPEDPTLDPAYWTRIVPMGDPIRHENETAIKNRETHGQLTIDLIDHLWNNHHPGEEEEENQPPDVDDYVQDEE